MAVIKARENSSSPRIPVATMGVGNASQSQRGLMTAQDKVKVDSIGSAPSGETDTLWNKVDKMSKYSTNEQVIGTWIDGKPLYRKVYGIGALPSSAGQKTVQTSLTFNTTNIIKMYGYAKSTGAIIPLPFLDLTSNDGSVGIFIDSECNITVRVAKDRSAYIDTYVVLEYTKNTD